MSNFVGYSLMLIGGIAIWATIPISILYAIYAIFVLQHGFFSGIVLAFLLAIVWCVGSIMTIGTGKWMVG